MTPADAAVHRRTHGALPLPAAPSPRPARAAASGPDAARLDDAQRAAVLHARGPARVLAPAGSGKTKTLVSRVVELVDRGCDPSGILMLAFNRKAAEQLEERLAALGISSTRRLGAPADAAAGSGRTGRHRRRPASSPGAPERPPGVHCATFNAFGYRYQREVMRARILLDHDGRALRDLMSRALETAGVSLRELKPRRGSDPVGAFVKGLTEVRAALLPPETVEVTLECLTDTPLVTVPFGPVHAQYLRAQTATGLQSFDDQIYFAVADMLADPAHRAFIQGRFDHVLVDEFQDLNGAQLALVDLLSRPRRQLFVVGDDDQLIYGWRQADPRGILEFHDRMPPRPHSATYTLCTNYRCSRAVVETGARLVAHNQVREAKDIRPRAGAQDGAVRFFGAPSWPERAAALRDFLLAERSRLDCDWRDLAVLCRYRSQQLLVALALDAGEIPRTPALGCTLFTHPAAALLHAYLDLVRAPDEVPAPALAGLLNRPNRFVPRAVVEAVAGSSRPWAHLCEAAAAEPAAGPRPLAALVELVGSRHAEFAPAASGQAATAPAAAAPAGAPDPFTSEDLVWAVVESFGLDDLWAAEADAAAAAGPSDGAGPLEVFDALLLLAETYPDPGRLPAHLGPPPRRRGGARGRRRRHARARGVRGRPRRHRHHPRRQGPRVPLGRHPRLRLRCLPLEPARGGGGAPGRLRGRHPRPRRRAVHRRHVHRLRPPVPARAGRAAGAGRARDAVVLARRGDGRVRGGARRRRRGAPRAHRRPPRGDRGPLPRTRPRRRPNAPLRDARGARHRGHSRSDGSGGATKCFAAGAVPGFR